jgi:hypothetical protein
MPGALLQQKPSRSSNIQLSSNEGPFMTIYRFSLQYNDSYAFREYPELTDNQRIHQELVPDFSGATAAGIHRCDACGRLTSKWDDPLNSLKVRGKKYDIAGTYDGITVASKEFKATCERAGLTGLTYRQLPRDSSFFAIRATRAVPFDAERRGTTFTNLCTKCGTYEELVGAMPVLLKAGADVGSTEFVGTDLEFGSDDGKSPLLLCGETAAIALKAAKLRGVDLYAI